MARIPPSAAGADDLLSSAFDGDLERRLRALPDTPRERRLDQTHAPYLDALRDYAEREPGRFHVPGHKGGTGTDAQLIDTIGATALAVDIPLVIPGVDVGADSALARAQEMAADAWGAKRSFFLSATFTPALSTAWCSPACAPSSWPRS